MRRHTVVRYRVTCVIFVFQAVLWRYKFSQLKGSSDDGKSKIKFLFQNIESKSIEAKVINMQRCLMLHVKENTPSKPQRYGEELLYRGVSKRLLVFYRSWSSQTCLQCFIVFTLSLLPKLLAWIRCLWRAMAPRPTQGSPLFPVSHVIHRHPN